MEERKKITREMLRKLEPGQSITVKLPNYSAVLTARVTIGQIRKIDGVELSARYDGVDGTMTITRA